MISRLESSNTLARVDDAAIYQYALLFGETEDIARGQAINQKLATNLEQATIGLQGEALIAAIRPLVDLRAIIARTSAQLRQQRLAIRQYLVEFGQTPAARSRVKVNDKNPAEPASPLARFLKAGS